MLTRRSRFREHSGVWTPRGRASIKLNAARRRTKSGQNSGESNSDRAPAAGADPSINALQLFQCTRPPAPAAAARRPSPARYTPAARCD
ncbi:hypothetical protein EVAR_44809_1 [Eumeta japonica]|uniref:Uncharacterized protein n=1 Tax=Eumeta variegata TaxID=151549 RepID=A0A4C1X8T6_EUMVA|nr:hypothetical protein EVAR_44809_1 [Eumeta japonica]